MLPKIWTYPAPLYPMYRFHQTQPGSNSSLDADEAVHPPLAPDAMLGDQERVNREPTALKNHCVAEKGRCPLAALAAQTDRTEPIIHWRQVGTHGIKAFLNFPI